MDGKYPIFNGQRETDYLELGPGHVLTNLVNQIKRKASPLIVEDKPTLVIEEIEKTAEKRRRLIYPPA